MLVIPAQLQSLLQQNTHRFATCWTIARKDGTNLFFTDHNSDLAIGTNTYLGSTGVKPSARQHASDLAIHNLELTGIIDSVIVTDSDLRSGLYRNAEVTEALVDWRYPWAGSYYENHYWIGEVKYTRSGWIGQVSGLSKWLKPKVGKLFTRNCPYRVGDLKCTADLTSKTHTGTIAAVTSINDFTSDLTQADGFYQYGSVTFTSGPNNGLQFDVKHFTHSDGHFILWLAPPFLPVVGNTFTAVVGCDHTLTMCDSLFGNVINFGGYPYIPGTDRRYLTPDIKI